MTDAATGGCQCGAVRFRASRFGRAVDLPLPHVPEGVRQLVSVRLVTAPTVCAGRDGEPKRFASSDKVQRGSARDAATPLTYERRRLAARDRNRRARRPERRAADPSGQSDRQAAFCDESLPLPTRTRRRRSGSRRRSTPPDKLPASRSRHGRAGRQQAIGHGVQRAKSASISSTPRCATARRRTASISRSTTRSRSPRCSTSSASIMSRAAIPAPIRPTPICSPKDRKLERDLHRLRHDEAARPLGLERSGPCRAARRESRRDLLRRASPGIIMSASRSRPRTRKISPPSATA